MTAKWVLPQRCKPPRALRTSPHPLLTPIMRRLSTSERTVNPAGYAKPEGLDADRAIKEHALASPASKFVQCSSEDPYYRSVYLITPIPHPRFRLHGYGADQEFSGPGTVDTDFNISGILWHGRCFESTDAEGPPGDLNWPKKPWCEFDPP